MGDIKYVVLNSGEKIIFEDKGHSAISGYSGYESECSGYDGGYGYFKAHGKYTIMKNPLSVNVIQRQNEFKIALMPFAAGADEILFLNLNNICVIGEPDKDLKEHYRNMVSNIKIPTPQEKANLKLI